MLRTLLLLAVLAVALMGCDYANATYTTPDGVSLDYRRVTLAQDRSLTGLDAGVDDEGRPRLKLEAADSAARVEAIIRLLEAAR